MDAIPKAIAQMLRNSARQIEHRKIGIEVERIGIWPDCTPLRYEPCKTKAGKERPGVRNLLDELHSKHGWAKETNEEGHPLGLTLESGKLSLEPGAQVELATEATKELGSLVAKANDFEQKVNEVTNTWGLNWIGLGVNPCNSVVDIDLIPSERYHIMTDYIQKQGQLATSMMRLTTSVQINLDYGSEEEGIEMLRVSLLAAPLSYALFSNSPILRGKKTQYLSYRRAIWARTDPDRVGILPEAFEEDFNFDSYAEIAWKRPLMFAINTNGKYVASNGLSLEMISQGKLPGVEPDEANQMSAIRQLFTEARLKPGYVEVRSIDGLRPAERYASAAFWMGLLYDQDARTFVVKELGHLKPHQLENLIEQTAIHGLQTRAEGIDMKMLAKNCLEVAHTGLKNRAFNEEKFLDPVKEIIDSGKNPATCVLEIYDRLETNKIKTVIAHCSQLNSQVPL